MKSYRVVWEIDIDANSPKEAAEEARRIQLDPESEAVVFDIFYQDETTHIDLLDYEEE